MYVCGDVWGSVVAGDGVARGGAGNGFVAVCVFVYGEGGKCNECGEAVR